MGGLLAPLETKGGESRARKPIRPNLNAAIEFSRYRKKLSLSSRLDEIESQRKAVVAEKEAIMLEMHSMFPSRYRTRNSPKRTRGAASGVIEDGLSSVGDMSSITRHTMAKRPKTVSGGETLFGTGRGGLGMGVSGEIEGDGMRSMSAQHQTEVRGLNGISGESKEKEKGFLQKHLRPQTEPALAGKEKVDFRHPTVESGNTSAHADDMTKRVDEALLDRRIKTGTLIVFIK